MRPLFALSGHVTERLEAGATLPGNGNPALPESFLSNSAPLYLVALIDDLEVRKVVEMEIQSTT